MLAYFNGKFINEQNAKVSINNRSFRYGDGFFETIKCINGQLPLWEFHAKRLFATLALLQFTPPNYLNDTYIKNLILELVGKNGLQENVRVRVTIYRGDGGIYDVINHQPNVLIQTWPLNRENNNWNENGLIIGEYTNGFKAADGFANLKTNNYLLYAMAALHAKKMHWNDALVRNHKGDYADATISNLWMVKDDKIFTPPLSDGPVEGTMRAFLLAYLPKNGFIVSEQSITPEILLSADEVFLTNAIYGIKWVKQFGEQSFSNQKTHGIFQSLVKPLWQGTISLV